MSCKKIYALLLFAFCFYSCGPDISAKKELTFWGVVTAKFEMRPCFSAIIIKHNKSLDTLKDICSCAPEKADVWDYIKPGDVIYKTKNSLIINVIRNRSIKEFDYPFCYQ